MGGERIVVVEDESEVAEFLTATLGRLGYVPIAAASAEAALDIIAETEPDLVLIDITLGDGSEGVSLAQEVYEQTRVPVVFLTAQYDDATLKRARASEPFGCVVKPVDGQNLRATIEMALSKHRNETKLKKIVHWMTNALNSVADGLLATNTQGTVLFMNSRAEELTGWKIEQAVNQYSSTIFNVVDAATGKALASPLKTAFLEEMVMRQHQDCVLIGADGEQTHIDYSASPLRDEDGKVLGAIIVFRDLRTGQAAAKVSEDLNQELRMLKANLPRDASNSFSERHNPLSD